MALPVDVPRELVSDKAYEQPSKGSRKCCHGRSVAPMYPR